MGKILGLVGLVVVVGLGLYFYNQQKGEGTDTAMEALDASQATKENLENKGLVSSIKDAMGLGTAMSCTYVVGEEGKTFESVVMVQGEKFRTDASVGGVATHALFDGTDQYVWTDGTKTGFKMSKACLEEVAKMAPGSGTATPPVKDAKEDFDMAKNVKCSPIADIDLSIPTDVTFTDQCAAMKDSMKMMEQYKTQMPSGTY